jgi:hypothetical protein
MERDGAGLIIRLIERPGRRLFDKLSFRIHLRADAAAFNATASGAEPSTVSAISCTGLPPDNDPNAVTVGRERGAVLAIGADITMHDAAELITSGRGEWLDPPPQVRVLGAIMRTLAAAEREAAGRRRPLRRQKCEAISMR